MTETNDEGRCRFNCRTQKEAFISGWFACIDWFRYAEDGDETETEMAENAFREWKRERNHKTDV